MSLWLSRLQLNPLSRSAILLAGDPNRLHQTIYGLFPPDRKGRLLFRVDTGSGGPMVLIQSGCEPDWLKLELAKRDLRSEPDSKLISIEPPAGSELAFRLLARPVKRISGGKGHPPGPRNDLRTDEERLDWLHRKGETSGFKVITCGLTVLSFKAIKSDAGFRTKGGSFAAVQFDGALLVTDPDKLLSAVEKGIGTQKAFGFGMLSLGRSS
jgi:CRISPR system Cascade subunit CasE